MVTAVTPKITCKEQACRNPSLWRVNSRKSTDVSYIFVNIKSIYRIFRDHCEQQQFPAATACHVLLTCLPMSMGATRTAPASKAHAVIMFAMSPTRVPSPMISMSRAVWTLQ